MKRERKTKQMNLRIDPDTLARFRLAAFQRGVSMSELLRAEIAKAAKKIAA